MFAWEWLRRDERYRDCALRSLEAGGKGVAEDAWACHAGAGRWGLHAFEWPGRSCLTARPVWRRDIHPLVLAVTAHPAKAATDVFELDRFGERATVLASAGGRQHALISDGLRTLRLDVIEGSVVGGQVSLRYRLNGLEAAERPLLSLRRLLGLWRAGNFPKALYPAEARARRWILLLRTHDALAAGVGQREIAATLLDPDSLRPRWRADDPSLRSRAQRLVRGARQMAADHRWLLR